MRSPGRPSSDAARELFSTKGYPRAGREEIVALAGVTRGALQHHFGDKESLFLAVYEATEQEVVTAISIAAMIGRPRSGRTATRRLPGLPGRSSRPCGAANMRHRRTGGTAGRSKAGHNRSLRPRPCTRGGKGGRWPPDQFEETPIEPLTRMLLAGVMAAAQFVATSDDHDDARAQAGRTVDLLLDRLKQTLEGQRTTVVTSEASHAGNDTFSSGRPRHARDAGRRVRNCN